MDKLDAEGKNYEMKIYGSKTSLNYKRIDLLFAPCMPVQLTYKNKNSAKRECIVNLRSKSAISKKLRETKSYLGSNLGFIFIANNKHLALDKFGEKAAYSRMNLESIEFDGTKTTWSQINF